MKCASERNQQSVRNEYKDFPAKNVKGTQPVMQGSAEGKMMGL